MTTQVADWMIGSYARTFVNRLAHSRQRHTPDEEGRAPFFLATDNEKRPLQLGPREIQQHLMGIITLGLYAISTTSTARWLAIDADYTDAFRDLTRLQLHFASLDITARLEASRRGGHLWIFAAAPLPANDAHRFLVHSAAQLGIPVKAGKGDGLELFPRQTHILKGQYGSAIRGPLGVHRKTNTRYWFTDAQPNLTAQLLMLDSTPRLTATHLQQLLPPAPAQTNHPQPSTRTRTPHRPRFAILDYLPIPAYAKKVSGNYVLQCPSCARQGRDRHRDNLHILIDDTNKYLCRAGCSVDDIRAALGAPPRKHFTPFQTIQKSEKEATHVQQQP